MSEKDKSGIVTMDLLRNAVKNDKTGRAFEDLLPQLMAESAKGIRELKHPKTGKVTRYEDFNDSDKLSFEEIREKILDVCDEKTPPEIYKALAKEALIRSSLGGEVDNVIKPLLENSRKYSAHTAVALGYGTALMEEMSKNIESKGKTYSEKVSLFVEERLANPSREKYSEEVQDVIAMGNMGMEFSRNFALTSPYLQGKAKDALDKVVGKGVELFGPNAFHGMLCGKFQSFFHLGERNFTELVRPIIEERGFRFNKLGLCESKSVLSNKEKGSFPEEGIPQTATSAKTLTNGKPADFEKNPTK